MALQAIENLEGDKPASYDNDHSDSHCVEDTHVGTHRAEDSSVEEQGADFRASQAQHCGNIERYLKLALC